MKTQLIDLKTPDGICDTFIAYPDDMAQYSAVILYMDAFGLRNYMYRMAQELAAQGYYVFMPNVFYRMGRAPVADIQFPIKPQDMPQAHEKLKPLFQQFNVQSAVNDAQVYLDFLVQQKQVKRGRIGSTGYCLGGKLSILTAANYPDQIAAAASFHAGNLATETPESPHHQLSKIKAELYIANADQDKSMPPEQIERLRQALDRSGVRYELETYTGATHGFTMMDLPAGNEAALQRHWQKLFALLERNLK